MRSIGGILRGFLVLSLVAAIASAVAAFVARGRLTSRGGPNDDDLELVAIYNGLDFASTAPALRHVAVTAWYGGGTLDLRGATLDPAGARMTIRAIFGGFRVIVPGTWRVEVGGTGIFGAFGDGRRADLASAEGPSLRLEGFAVFGGVGIVSEAQDREGVRTEDLPPEAAPSLA
jgi:hypothetical protein